MTRTRSNSLESIPCRNAPLQSLRRREPRSPREKVIRVKGQRTKVKPLPRVEPTNNGIITTRTKCSTQEPLMRRKSQPDLTTASNTSSLPDFDDDSSESSGDDDLPAIFDPSAPKTKVTNFAPGTVVWAKSRGWPYWPAMLVRVFSNHKKAWITYFDKETQTVQVNLRCVVLFTESSKCKFLEVGKNSKFREDFMASCDKAEDYLVKRGLGKLADSACNTSLSSDLNTSFHSPPTSPSSTSLSLDVSHDMPPTESAILCCANLSSDEEIHVGYPIKSNGHHRNRDGEVQEDASVTKRRKAWLNIQTRLLKYIHRDTTKNYLLAIYTRKIKCARQVLFESTRRTDKEQLRSLIGLGPFSDDKMADELTEYLKNLYVEYCMSVKEDLANLAYITEVWLPEAIIFAIQKTRRVGRKLAEKLFMEEGVQSLVDQGEDVIPLMDNSVFD